MGEKLGNFKNVMSNDKQRSVLIFTAVVILGTVLVGFYLLKSKSGNDAIQSSVQVSNIPNMNTTPGSSDSSEYNKKQLEANRIAAEKALTEGKSHQPTLVNNNTLNSGSAIDLIEKESADRKKADEEKLKQQAIADEQEKKRLEEIAKSSAPAQPINATNSANNQQQVNQAPKQKYSYDDLILIASLTNINKSKSTYIEQDYTPKAGANLLNNANNNNVNATVQPSVNTKVQQEVVAIQAGTILNAVLETSINSDEPSPIRARIVSGEFKNSILIGQMTKSGEKVVVQYNRISIPNAPKSYAISAVAVDPNTSRTALATDVDRHLFQRYVIGLAASFVKGYAEAISRQNTVTTISPLGSIIVDQSALDTKQINRAALGEVGKSVAEDVKKDTDRGPTIHVDAGIAIGVLLMDDLVLK